MARTNRVLWHPSKGRPPLPIGMKRLLQVGLAAGILVSLATLRAEMLFPGDGSNEPGFVAPIQGPPPPPDRNETALAGRSGCRDSRQPCDVAGRNAFSRRWLERTGFCGTDPRAAASS